jgi:adenylate cyclase
MLFALDRLQAEMHAKGFPKPDIGIGLNSGSASVGNMGSDVRFSYTAMGDSVNLASRLESLTKSYNIKIMISEFTAAKLSRSQFLFRDLDDIRVKGKNEPVRVFELMRPDYLQTPNQVVAFIQRFEEGREHYRKQEWNLATKAFTACLAEKLNDGPSQLYLERCRDFLQHPPEVKDVAVGWDGVYNFTHK